MRARTSLLSLLSLVRCSTPAPAPDASAADATSDALADGTIADAINERSNERPDDILSITIDPPRSTITVRDAVASTVTLAAQAVRRDGTRVPLTNGVWSVPSDRLGTVSADGVFTASGAAGGVATVQLQAPGAGGATLSASATIEITVSRTIATSGTVAEHTARFADSATMDAARAANILYPLDGAIMPNNVAPADVQWERGAMGEVFRVQIRKTHATVTAYVTYDRADFRLDWVVDRALWRTLADTDLGEPCVLTVDRALSGGAVIAGDPVRFTFADNGIFGNVYYWYWTGSTEGQIMRVADGSAERTRAIPNPPPDPSRGQRCPGCHTASRDGRFLATPLGGGVDGAAVFDFTADLSGNPSPSIFATNQITGVFFMTFDPTAQRLLGVDAAGTMLEYNARTGARVMASGLPMSNAIHPEWSPNGGAVAFVQRSDGGGDIYTRGDLAIIDVTDTETFGAARVLHRGADLSSAAEGGAADAHPTWSPDSRWIAFAHGEHSYSGDSFNNLSDPRALGGALYVVPRAGGAPTRLDRANGGAMGRDSYWPTFSPFVTRQGESGGYYWLAFMSRREYGNARAGTRGLRSQGRGGGRLQLWVTAIDLDAPAGTDPSHPAYWLPGQDLATGNFGAYWSPVACRANTTSCTSDGDCCSGRCRPDPMNPSANVCQPPPPAECRRAGQTCGAGGDCCSGLSCFANVCQPPIG